MIWAVSGMRRSRSKLATLQPMVGVADLMTAGTVGTERIRGRRLQDIRSSWRMRAPLCVECEKAGRVRLWTQLDHIIPLFKGGADHDSNRQGLCDECHAVKTREDMSGGIGKP